MPASAPDIITYIGVPLAVLGVLPILFTAIRTFLLSYKIRHELAKNLTETGLRRHVTTNTDILSGQVDVKYEPVRLWPLHTAHKDYASVRSDTSRSSLKGGSWTILNWSVDTIDWTDTPPKKYTLTPTDSLRQPAARISFASLVHYLLSLGAVENSGGLEKLNAEEQRVVPGTVLLKSRDGSPILSVTTRENDEDNDTLALKLGWSGVKASCSGFKPESHVRLNWFRIISNLESKRHLRTNFLPPTRWGKGYSLSPAKSTPKTTQNEEDQEPSVLNIATDRELRTPSGRTCLSSEFTKYEEAEIRMEAFERDLEPDEVGWEDILGSCGSDTDSDTWSDPQKHAQSKEQRMSRLKRIKNNFQTRSNYLKEHNVVDPALFCTDREWEQPKAIDVHIERAGIKEAQSKQMDIEISHLLASVQSEERPGDWFSAFTKALAARSKVLCKYDIPDIIQSFAQEAYKLKSTIPCGVLLHLEMISPEDCPNWKPEDHHQIYFDKCQEMRRAFPFRQAHGSSHRPFDNEPSQLQIMQQVEKNRVPYALSSPRWPVNKVANLLTPWLLKEFEFEEGATIVQIAEWTLHRMLLYPAESVELARMLNIWQAWSDQNSMNETDFQSIRGHKTTFALAACLLNLLGEYVSSTDPRAPDLLEECLAKWDDVLLN